MVNESYPNIQPPTADAQIPPFLPPMQMRRIPPRLYPKWLSRNAIFTYLLALIVVTVMYSTYSLPWYYMLSGMVSVLLFFLYGRVLALQTTVEKINKEKTYEIRLFLIAFIPRLLWMILIYTIFMQTYGDSFGFDNSDSVTYDTLARKISDGLRHEHLNLGKIFKRMDLSDRGYATYLGFVYFLFDDSVIVSRILKCIWSSLTVLLLYRLAKRNFGAMVARIAAISCALWPNFWYYCGCQLKEVEMVFLVVLFIEQSDQMLRSRQFTAWKIIPILLVAAAIFTFRTPLGIVVLLALIFSVVMSSAKVVSWWKRIIVGALAVAMISVAAGTRIEERAQEMIEVVQNGYQEQNMEWRARRTQGNTFAKYASKAVFAPMIFTIPFPTMVRPFDGQNVQQLLNGGNFIKNVLSYFTIFAILMMVITGKWRDHLLPLSFVFGYLLVLTVSAFAQSERFHQPAMPFELMLASYGLSVALTKKRYKRWFGYWCAIMFVAVIVWNWFKLAGRGLV